MGGATGGCSPTGRTSLDASKCCAGQSGEERVKQRHPSNMLDAHSKRNFTSCRAPAGLAENADGQSCIP